MTHGQSTFLVIGSSLIVKYVTYRGTRLPINQISVSVGRNCSLYALYATHCYIEVGWASETLCGCCVSSSQHSSGQALQRIRSNMRFFSPSTPPYSVWLRGSTTPSTSPVAATSFPYDCFFCYDSIVLFCFPSTFLVTHFRSDSRQCSFSIVIPIGSTVSVLAMLGG